jgi:hypothetical protein
MNGAAKMKLETPESLLAEIKAGKTIFQAISKESCSMLGIEAEEDLTEAQATMRKNALDRLEASGRVRFFKSGGGFYTIL